MARRSTRTGRVILLTLEWEVLVVLPEMARRARMVPTLTLNPLPARWEALKAAQ